jgi:hypothetical protein
VYPLGVEQLDLLPGLFAEWGGGKMGIEVRLFIALALCRCIFISLRACNNHNIQRYV